MSTMSAYAHTGPKLIHPFIDCIVMAWAYREALQARKGEGAFIHYEKTTASLEWLVAKVHAFTVWVNLLPTKVVAWTFEVAAPTVIHYIGLTITASIYLLVFPLMFLIMLLIVIALDILLGDFIPVLWLAKIGCKVGAVLSVLWWILHFVDYNLRGPRPWWDCITDENEKNGFRKTPPEDWAPRGWVREASGGV